MLNHFWDALDYAATGATAIAIPVLLTTVHSMYKNYINIERYNEVMDIQMGNYQLLSNLFNSMLMTSSGSGYPMVGAAAAATAAADETVKKEEQVKA